MKSLHLRLRRLLEVSPEKPCVYKLNTQRMVAKVTKRDAIVVSFCQPLRD